jgi:hypothetical protein
MDADTPMLKTKLGAARPAVLKTMDGAREVIVFHSTGTGKPLAHEESGHARRTAYRTVFLSSEGKYRGRTPFRAVFGVVGGAERVVLYDRFGLAARWEGEKPVFRRRGLKFTAEREAILAFLFEGEVDVLGFTGAYRCPACAAAKSEPIPGEYLRIPLCAHCFSRGGKERDWVGTWQCPACGDRVKEEELLCPFCAQLEAEAGG